MFIAPDDFRAIALAMGLREIAMEDALMNYDQSASSDQSVRDFLNGMRESRPHWWTVVTDGTEVNDAVLYNVDAQSRYAKENGVHALGDLLARRGLRLGQTLKGAPDAKGDGDDLSTNPWSLKFKGDITARDARIASILRMNGGGTAMAARLAKAAGTVVGKPLKTA